MNGMNIKNLSG